MSNGGKNKILYIAALAIVAIVIVAGVVIVMWPKDEAGDQDDDYQDVQQLYAHISFGLFTKVSSPTVKILVDVDGDGTMDTTEIVTPAMSEIGGVYSSSINKQIVQLDANATTFRFLVQVYDGEEQLMYSVNDETHTGPIADGSTDSWNYYNMDPPMNMDCEITIIYQVLTYGESPL